MNLNDVRGKLDVLAANQKQLEWLRSLPQADFLADVRNLDSTLHRLQTSIQALLDIAAYVARPGRGLPPWCGKFARSPMTTISGWPGKLRSGSTVMRPASRYLRLARYSSRSAACWAVRPASCPAGINDSRDGCSTSTSLAARTTSWF